MGYYFGYAAELAIFFALGVIQWNIGLAAYLLAGRHLAPRAAGVARGLLFVAGAVVLLGLVYNLPNAFSWPMNASGFEWLHSAALLWAVTSAPSWVIYRVVRAFLRPAEQTNPGRRALLGAAIAAPFAVVGYGAFIERTDFQVREIEVPVPDLHPDLAGLRLVQVSDIHLSPFLTEREFARVVDAANELRPHLMLVTGDLISVRGDPLDACLRQISRLRAEAGVLGCLGNHEISAGVEDYTTEQAARLGIPFLRGHARQLRFGNAPVNIAGFDYQRISRRGHYLDGARSLVAPGALNILLQHNPDVFPTAAGQGWDLTLSGHTHGGQINIEILHQNLNVARFYTPFVYGLYRSGRSSIYVTRGIGTIGMPARLGAPPEIAALRLRMA